MIGVGASMAGELDAFESRLDFARKERIGCFDFSVYTLGGEEIACGVCGTGKASAAAFCQAMILSFKPRLIANIGTAGSITPEAKKKDLIVVTETVQHDFDISPFGYRRAELPELGEIALKSDGRFLEIARSLDLGGMRAHFGRALTGDCAVVLPEEADRLKNEFGGLCADMESAAFAMVCRMNDVPFAGIRCISDDGEGDRHESFRANIGTAAENCAAFLERVLEKY
jgi:adenosylhomocysteine nucleosidase